jgi:phage I-like protein
MALAALLSLLGVQSEAEGIQLVTSYNTFLSDAKVATGATDTDGTLRAIQSNAALVRQLETSTGKQGAEAVKTALAWKEPAEQSAQLATQVATLEADKTSRERDGYIAELSTAGKLPPALHNWAKTQTKAQLEAWAKDAPAFTGGAPAIEGASGEGVKPAQSTVGTTLSAEELEVCKHLQLTPKQFLERKQFEAANPNTPFATNTGGSV